MANQIEATKLNQLVVIGPDENQSSVTKLVMHVLLIPGEGVDTSNKQGHVYSQIIRRS